MLLEATVLWVGAFAALALDRGLAEGPLFISVAVLAIVLTAPIGVVTLQHGVDRLLPNEHPT